MNIEMINNHNGNHSIDTEKTGYSKNPDSNSKVKNNQTFGYSLDISGSVNENAAYGKEELKSAKDIAKKAGMSDVKLNRNYMAVMANSMSPEDFQELMKDGVNPADTTVKDGVTNLDKIKIKMAEAGVTIAGYNDDLSAEEIANAVGSELRAEQLANDSSNVESDFQVDIKLNEIKSLSKSDMQTIVRDALESSNLPVTEDNEEGVLEAVNIASNLTDVTDEAKRYILTEDLDTTIEDIYKAEYSSGMDNRQMKAHVNYSGLAAYGNIAASKEAWGDLKEQALAIVKEAGIDDTEAGLEDAKWLIEHQVPLTVDTLQRYSEIKELVIPSDLDSVLKSIMAAIKDGKNPKQADITQTESLYERAVRIVNDFNKLPDGEDIHKRRQLEEVRLAMTAEANLALLRKGIQIETRPLELLVEDLKAAEKEFYRPLLENENDNPLELSLDEKIDIYKETRSVIEAIPQMPAKSIADVVITNAEVNDFDLDELVKAGEISKAEYARAGASYEALMTAPRADMGDSIRKAFANVDDILQDLGLDVNEVNRKAVRTLGYANSPITTQNIEKVREATMTVQRVITLMTPAKTLSMIREGHNPLKENIYDLEKSLSEEDVLAQGEKYSQYLYKLDKAGKITDEEREAYIGMYRLFNLIEKQDGRVIGNVLSSGQELTMSNMLAAARSNKHKNMDVKVDDDFGLLDELVARSDSISDQISKGFVELMMEPISREYVEEKLEEVRKAVKKSDSTSKILEALEEPVTAENILAASDIFTGGNSAIKKLFGIAEDKNREDKSRVSNRLNRLDSDRSLKSVDDADIIEAKRVLNDEDINNLINGLTDMDSAVKAYAQMTDKSLEGIEKKIVESEDSVDVREWSLVYKQIGIGAKLSRHNSFDIPIKTEDGYTSIHLTIRQTDENVGKVTASFASETYGNVRSQFAISDKGIDGFIVSDSRAGIAALENIENQLTEAFTKEGIRTDKLSFVYGRNANEDDFARDLSASKVTNNDLYRVAKAFVVTLNRV